MKRPQFTFFQGSTPTLVFALPYALSPEDSIYATFSQGGQTVTEYTYGGVPYTPAPSGNLTPDEESPCVLRVSLSQTDTFLFKAGDCELQIRVLKPNGSADTLFPVRGYVGKAQKDGVI